MNKFIIIFTLILNSFVIGQVKDTIIDGKKTVIYSSIENEAVFSNMFLNIFKWYVYNIPVSDAFFNSFNNATWWKKGVFVVSLSI